MTRHVTRHSTFSSSFVAASASEVRDSPTLLTPCGARRSPEGCDDFETCLVEVDFNKLPDKAERQRLKHLPTSFHLAAEDVDALRVTARELITSSPDFQAFMRATGGRMSSPASP